MKRTLCLLIMALCLIVSPLTVSARTYEISDTDMTVAFDDSVWYVFTRDNIAGNPELAELGISYDQIHQIMLDNNIYVDAVLYYDDGDYVELLAMVEADDNYVNLSNYDDNKVLDMGEATFDGYVEKEDIKIFENDYKYFLAEYVDSNVHLIQYITVINGYAYSFQFQSPEEFTEEKREVVKGIMENVTFEVDTTMKEKNLFLANLLDAFRPQLTAIAFMAGIAVLAAPVIIIITVVKNRKAKKNDFDQLQL